MLTAIFLSRELAAADLGPDMVEIPAQLIQATSDGSLNASKHAANK